MPPIIVPGFETLDGGHATLRAASVRVILVLSAIIIIGREIAISALREWMAEIGQRGKVKVSSMGKLKTIMQIVGLSCMLFRWDLTLLPGVTLPVFEIGLVLTVVAAFLTLISAISYLRAAWPDLRGNE
jgi:CDP-diacylglycerol--glycerol-3-phosphate 3-phosphatidyltransferase